MKFPKNWDKRNLNEQETWLVGKLNDLYAEEKTLRRMLAQVRGGKKIEIITDERIDEVILKSA